MFITFEGSEGSGKSSQQAQLAEYLRGRGVPLLVTREPGGTEIGEQVRAILSDLKNTAMHPRAEILLFQASRAQLVEQVIRPHLEKGGVVLCDRYADSTIAYQGYGYQLVDLAVLREIVSFATGGLQPDLTLLLDLDVDTLALPQCVQVTGRLPYSA
jgi:dTMP kinase